MYYIHYTVSFFFFADGLEPEAAELRDFPKGFSGVYTLVLPYSRCCKVARQRRTTVTAERGAQLAG